MGMMGRKTGTVGEAGLGKSMSTANVARISPTGKKVSEQLSERKRDI